MGVFLFKIPPKPPKPNRFSFLSYPFPAAIPPNNSFQLRCFSPLSFFQCSAPYTYPPNMLVSLFWCHFLNLVFFFAPLMFRAQIPRLMSGSPTTFLSCSPLSFCFPVVYYESGFFVLTFLTVSLVLFHTPPVPAVCMLEGRLNLLLSVQL